MTRNPWISWIRIWEGVGRFPSSDPYVLQGEPIMLLKRSTIKCLANQCLMVQSEVMIRPHNWSRYPIPPPFRFKNVISDQRSPGSKMKQNAHSSVRQNDSLRTWSIHLRQSRVSVSQESQQVRNEHADLSPCFSRPFPFRKIKDIPDSPDRGMRL